MSLERLPSAHLSSCHGALDCEGDRSDSDCPRQWTGRSVWYPLQHALGIDTFGANLFVATRADQTLVEEHDERSSGQQELYVVLEGEVVFQLDGEEARLDQGTAVAVTDPQFAAAREP